MDPHNSRMSGNVRIFGRRVAKETSRPRSVAVQCETRFGPKSAPSIEPEFRVEVARHRRERRARLDAWRDRIVDLEIADRSKRLERLNRDQQALDAVRAERAADPTVSNPEFLARFEERYSLGGHFHWRAGFRIATDTCPSEAT